MSEYLTNTEDLTTVADAIRAKSGQTGQLIYPDGFASAVAGIKKAPTGPYMDVLEYVEETDTDGNTDHYIKRAKLYNHTRISAHELEGQFDLQELDYSDPSNNITAIETYAFASGNLDGIAIPATVTKLGHSCFAGTRIGTLTIPAGINTIPVSAFEGTYGDSAGTFTVILNTGITKIENRAFADSAIKTINIPNTVTTIGQEAFASSQLASITLSTALTEIAFSLFADCMELNEISLPQSITKIGKAAFRNTGLTSIIIPASVSELGPSMLRDCYSLASIELLGNPTIIPEYFAGGTAITSFVIPSSVTTIGAMAFATPNNTITEITCFATTPPTLGNKAFGNSLGFTIKVPSASVAAYKAATNWSDYADQIVGV